MGCYSTHLLQKLMLEVHVPRTYWAMPCSSRQGWETHYRELSMPDTLSLILKCNTAIASLEVLENA